MPYTLSHQTPSTGFISWSDVSIVYDGTTHAVANGSTNRTYVWWRRSTPGTFQTTDVYPTLGAEDALVFINRSGVGASVLDSAVVDGGLIVPGTVIAQAIAAGAIRAEHLSAGAITAGAIEAYAIQAEHLMVDAVQAMHITAGAIETEKLAANSVEADKIATNAIVARHITAGSIVSDKIAANAITAGKIAAGAITAAEIAAGSIRAQHLLIAPKSLNLDTSFEAGTTLWTGFVRRLPRTDAAVPTGCPVSHAAEFNVRDGISAARIDVVPGETYRFGGYCNRGTGTAAAPIGYVVIYYDATGAFLTAHLSFTTLTGWQRPMTTSVAPANAAFARFGAWADRGGTTTPYTGEAWYADAVIEKAMDASLIVDGAITATKIQANAITATQIDAASVRTAVLVTDSITSGMIQANAITATKIQAGAIVASKIGIGDTSNIIKNPDFAGGSLDGWETGPTVLPRTDASVPAGAPATHVATRPVTTGFNVFAGSAAQRFPVRPGEVYYMEVTVASTVDANSYLELRLACTDANNQNEQWHSVGPTRFTGASTTWTVVSNRFTVPATIGGIVPAYARFLAFINPVASGAAGSYFITNVKVRRANTGELIVDGAITTNHMTAGSINADRLIASSVTAQQIAADSITARAITIVDLSNMVPNPVFADGTNGMDGWSTPSLTSVVRTTAGVPANCPFARVLPVPVQTGNRDVYTSRWMPVIPGETYYVEALVASTADANSASVHIGMHFRDTAGAGNAWIQANTLGAGQTATHQRTAATTTWTRIHGIVTVPATVQSVATGEGRFWFAVQGIASPVGTWYVTNLKMRKANDASLIVDGTIEGRKIVARTIHAGLITAGTLTAGEIAAGSITTSRLTLTDTTQGYPDPDLADPDFYGDGTNFGTTTLTTLGATLPVSTVTGAGRQALIIAANAAERDVRSRWFLVEHGAEYRFEINAWRGGTTGTFSVFLEAGQLDASGNVVPDGAQSLTVVGAAGNTDATIAARVGLNFTTATTTKRMRILFRRHAGGDGNAGFGFPELRRRANANLIVDGSIVAAKIDTNAVTADKIQAGAVTSAKLTISTDRNRLANSDFYAIGTVAGGPAAGLDSRPQGWAIGSGTHGLSLGRWEAAGHGMTTWPTWAPRGMRALGFSISGTPAANTTQEFFYSHAAYENGRLPCRAGQRYEFSIYGQAHGAAQIYVQVVFYDSAGAIVAGTGASGTTQLTGTADVQSASLQSWSRIGGFITAPATAVSMTFVFGTRYVGGVANPHSFFSGAYLGEALPAQTELSAWGPGSSTIIHGDHMQTGTINANRIVAASITATQIAANAIDASKLRVNAQGVSTSALSFQIRRTNGALTNHIDWTAGIVFYMDATGAPAFANVVTGTHDRSSNTGVVWYYFWDMSSPTVIQATTDYVSILNNANRVLMATVHPGTPPFLNATFGSTTIDGGRITTQSISANEIAVGTIIANRIASNQINGDHIVGDTVWGKRIYLSGNLSGVAGAQADATHAVTIDGVVGAIIVRWNGVERLRLGHRPGVDFGIWQWAADGSEIFTSTDLNGVRIRSASIGTASIGNLTVTDLKIANRAISTFNAVTHAAPWNNTYMEYTVRAGAKIMIMAIYDGQGFSAPAISGQIAPAVRYNGNPVGQIRLYRCIVNSYTYATGSGESAGVAVENDYRVIPTIAVFIVDATYTGVHSAQIDGWGTSYGTAGGVGGTYTLIAVEYSK